MTENPGRIRALLDDTLTDEPPLLNLVPDAVTGAAHARRRSQVMAGGAAVAVLAVAVGASYGIGGHSHGRSGAGASPGGSGTPSSTAPAPKSHKSDFGIPGLFDHPGTPQQECAKLNMTSPEFKKPGAAAQGRAYCVRALTQFRALLPDAVVVLEPTVDFGQPGWSAPLMKTPDGATAPGFTKAYQAAAKNPSKVWYDEVYFAFHTSRGDGLITYQTLQPGAKAKPEPGWEGLPLGDGTNARLASYPDGEIGVSGVTAAGRWYDLVVTGVTPVYSAGNHYVFPDGYVTTEGSGPETVCPNPYTDTEIRSRIEARGGLGTLVNGIGADPVSVVDPTSIVMRQQ